MTHTCKYCGKEYEAGGKYPHLFTCEAVPVKIYPAKFRLQTLFGEPFTPDWLLTEYPGYFTYDLPDGTQDVRDDGNESYTT